MDPETPSLQATGADKGEHLLFSGGYLYRNLYLDRPADQVAYEALKRDKNQILAYQAETSSAVRKFIDAIRKQLLEDCKSYGTGLQTRGTYYERAVCVDRYISKLYHKLEAALAHPQKKYV